MYSYIYSFIYVFIYLYLRHFKSSIGEGNEQSGTGQTITGTGNRGHKRQGLQNKTGSTHDVTRSN